MGDGPLRRQHGAGAEVRGRRGASVDEAGREEERPEAGGRVMARRTTHTYAVLEVTPMAFVEIRRLLTAAGYAQAFHDDVIDMHGLALKALGTGPSSTNVEVGTLLSQRTKQGMVEIAVNGERVQMDLDKARAVLRMLSGAIEAAVSDTLIYQFLTTKVGLSDDQASRALLDFRELRQGTRAVVYPQ